MQRLLFLFLPALALHLNGPAVAQNGDRRAPSVTVTIGHPYISSMAFAPNARWMVSGGGDNTAKIWDVATGRMLRTLAGHPKFLNGVAVSPDGRKIASLDADHHIKIWDPETGQNLRTIKGDGLGLLRFSQDSKSLFAQGLTVLRRYDVANGAVAQTYTPAKLPNFESYLPNALAVSSDERFIATARICNPTYNDHKCLVSVWDVRSGRLLRTWQAGNQVTVLAFSPDGRWLASAGQGSKVDLWDHAYGRLAHRLETSSVNVTTITFSPDSGTLFAGSEMVEAFEPSTGRPIWQTKLEKSHIQALVYDPTLQVLAAAGGYFAFLEPTTGKLLRTIKGHTPLTSEASVMTMPDGNWLVSSEAGLTSWDPTTGQLLKPAGPQLGRIISGTKLPDGGTLVLAIHNKGVRLWTFPSGQIIREFEVTRTKDEHLLDAALSGDARLLATAMYGTNEIRIWDATTGQFLRSIVAYEQYAKAIAFAPDGRKLVSAGWNKNGSGPTKFWDAATGALLLSRTENEYVDVERLSFSSDGRVLFSGDNGISNEAFKIRDPQSGRPIRGFKHGFNLSSYASSPDGRFFATTGGLENETKLWNATNGRLLFNWQNNFGSTQSIAFSQDSKQVIVVTSTGVIVVRSAENGSLLTTTVQSASGEWVTITPEGFFAASNKGAALLHLVTGFDTTGIDQVYQSLYRPDFVREKLAGDPRGRVREAAARLDLGKILASGNAPDVRLTLPGRALGAGNVDGDSVVAEAEIIDRGGGVGRVEWRVNGVTAGIDAPAPAPSPARVSRRLALDPGGNNVEVVAYNMADLIASVPARIDVTAQVAAAPSSVAPQPPVPGTAAPAPVSPQAAAKPRLFVLVAGVDDYAEKRIKLSYAVSDAKAIARGFEQASGNLYRSVEVKLMTDAEVTKDKLDAAFTEMTGKSSIADMFVLYLAGHGKTVDGRYYFIPQDFAIDGEFSDRTINDALKLKGIAQDQWQKWFASVPARRSVILFDTCDSGTLAGDETQELERTAANDRLAQATGRSIIAASGGSEEAIEGYRGHGLFTYNVLDAIFRSDGDNSGTVELNELAAYVYGQVSELSQKVFKRRQVPQMKLTGNYPLARPTRILMDEAVPVAESKPAYQVAQTAQLQVAPAAGATVVRSLSANTRLTVLENRNGWSLVASDGKPLGYVATRDLAPAQ